MRLDRAVSNDDGQERRDVQGMEFAPHILSVQSTKLLGDEHLSNSSQATTAGSGEGRRSEPLFADLNDNTNDDLDLDSTKSSSRSSASPSCKEEHHLLHHHHHHHHEDEGAGPLHHHLQRVHFDANANHRDEQGQLDDRRLRRQIANCNERRRMQSINAGFQALRQFLPQKGGEKMSKAAILQQTAELIQRLQAEKERLGHSAAGPHAAPENGVGSRTPPKRRRMDHEETESANRELTVYMKTIDELQKALSREQQLRLIYEQELIELHKKTSPIGLDASLASIAEILRKGETMNANRPNVSQSEASVLSTLSPTKEINQGQLTELHPNKSLLGSLALQQQQQQQQQQHQQQQQQQQLLRQSTVLGGGFFNEGALSAAGGHVRVLHNGLLGAPVSPLASISLPLSFSQSGAAHLKLPEKAVRSSVHATVPMLSMPAGLPPLGPDQGSQNLNALFEAIKQLESANLSGQKSGAGLAPTSAAISQADLLVR